MLGSWRFAFTAATISMVVASAADAFGGRLGMFNSPSVTYHYAIPTYAAGPYYYCPPTQAWTPQILPVPDARPTPAPPSPTGEPPLHKIEKKAGDSRMPVIVTSHAVGANFVPGAVPLAKDRCRVGFWNLSGREVSLLIEGKTWTLPRDRAVTLDLDRQFAWQVEGRSQHVERVTEGQSTHEVIIRE